MNVTLKPVDAVRIVSLADNYVDLVSMDNTEVVSRAMPLKGMEFSNSILAEHGFSTLVATREEGQDRTMVFDFGLSPDAAARNADALAMDLTQVQQAALSHGHLDHFGGLEMVAEKIGKPGLEFVCHPGAFRQDRYLEPIPEVKITMPCIDQQRVEKAGFTVVAAQGAKAMLEDTVLFLGEIPRQTEFEKGMPNMFFENNGDPIQDPLDEDTALVMNVKGKGLVILTGCAHAGIVNTVLHAKNVTGVDKIHAVMGGFHLTGAAAAPLIEPTVATLKELALDYVIPTHCTGYAAQAAIKEAMPGQFILNMSGTTLNFTA